jgi:hypothetical protein
MGRSTKFDPHTLGGTGGLRGDASCSIRESLGIWALLVVREMREGTQRVEKYLLGEHSGGREPFHRSRNVDAAELEFMYVDGTNT